MRILFLGSPDFAVPPLEALVQHGYTVVAAVTPPDKPAGRKRVLTPPPVKVAAQHHGIPVLQTDTLRDAATIEQLAALQPDIGVVAAYGKLLRKRVLELPPLGYLNIHPSLLPRQRGPAPVAGAILAGETETGVTIMKLDAGMDSGPILAQVTVPLLPTSRTGPLTVELFRLGSDALLDVLPRYAAGQLELRPQDDSQATYTHMLKKEHGTIDWSLPAQVIERQIRAYDPWPGTHTFWNEQRINVHAALVHPDATDTDTESPGTLICTDSAPFVSTGSGLLELLELQPAGKRLMTGREWLHGQRNPAGLKFGSQSVIQ